MAELDFGSGQPIMRDRAAKKKLQTQRDREKKGHFERLSRDLQSEGGEMIVAKMKKILAARIDKLVAEDEYCQGILQGIKEIGAELEDGQQAAKRIMDELVKVK